MIFRKKSKNQFFLIKISYLYPFKTALLSVGQNSRNLPQEHTGTQISHFAKTNSQFSISVSKQKCRPAVFLFHKSQSFPLS